MLLFIIVLVLICPIVFAVSSTNSKNTALQQVVTLNPDIKNKEDYLAARQVIDKKQQTIQEKRAKYSKFHPGILMCILVVLEIIVLTIINPKFNFTMCCSIIIFALELIFGVIGHDRKVNKIKELDKKLQTLNDEYYQIACSYLANYHNITVEKLLYDLPYVFNAQIDQTNWWLSLNNIAVINEALKIKYNYVMTDIEKSNLQVQQLKLQNEGIAIDNQQKKFWTCNFCGNMNRAEDMQCIKCGGQRSI